MIDTSPGTLADMVGEAGYALRLPKDLKAELERLAKQNRRSLNSEIVWRLEQSVAERKA